MSNTTDERKDASTAIKQSLSTTRYDAEVDALYIDLSEAPVEDTVEIAPGIMVDLDDAGNVIGVEILDYQARLREQGQVWDGLETLRGASNLAT